MSTYEVLAQLMEDMLYPQPTEIRQAIRAEPNKGRTMARGNQARHQSHDFILVLLLCHNSSQARGRLLAPNPKCRDVRYDAAGGRVDRRAKGSGINGALLHPAVAADVRGRMLQSACTFQKFFARLDTAQGRNRIAFSRS